MSMHDDLLEMRMQLVAVIDAADNKSLACAQAGIHRSNYYRWRKYMIEPAAHPLAGVSYIEREMGLHWVLLTVLLVFLGYFRFLVDGLVLYGGETSSSPLFPPSMVGGFDPDDDRYT